MKFILRRFLYCCHILTITPVPQNMTGANLIEHIKYNRCTPFIRAEACQHWHPLGSEIALD